MRSTLTLGERIFTARRRVHASQGEIAAACNTNRQQVSKWERGLAVPDLLETINLARYTQTSLDFFTEDLDLRIPDKGCDLVFQSDDPRLFDLDEVPVVIDLRDNVVTNLIQSESLAPYAFAS